MSRIAYVNGRYVPHRDAAVHIEDRGYQFADGVYEVVTVVNGALIDEQPHLERLDRSLGELQMSWPVESRALKVILRQVVRRNRLRTGTVYLQVTRGVAPRSFEFPKHTNSALVVTARHMPNLTKRPDPKGISVISIPDIRWGRCDIKTVGLLPAALGKQKAINAGVADAWQIEPDGTVTEGTSNNAWIVTMDGELVTRAPTHAILNGITRQRILKIAQEKGLRFVERAFTVEEAKQAREAFISSASSFVKPVTKIDDQVIGNGHMGELTTALYDGYEAFMNSVAAG